MEFDVRQSTGDEHSNMMDAMRANFDNQNDAKVGIFWYWPAKARLYGIRSGFADDIKFNSNGVKTIRDLHRSVWAKNAARPKDAREYGVWSGDYTQIPKGRVWQEESTGSMYVTVGDWIRRHEDAKPLIVDEFDLPADVEFRYDRHWDIGHGWSE